MLSNLHLVITSTYTRPGTVIQRAVIPSWIIIPLIATGTQQPVSDDSDLEWSETMLWFFVACPHVMKVSLQIHQFKRSCNNQNCWCLLLWLELITITWWVPSGAKQGYLWFCKGLKYFMKVSLQIHQVSRRCIILNYWYCRLRTELSNYHLMIPIKSDARPFFDPGML